MKQLRLFRFSESIYKLETAQNYIHDMVRKLDWPSYAISKHIPKQVRQDYLNICYFHNELARIEESTKERSLGIGKLNYWNDCIDQVFKDSPPKEPLAICLHDSCKKNPLPKYLFQKMINYRIKQVEQPEFYNINEMASAAESNRGPQFLLFLRLLRIDIENDQLKQLTSLSAQSVGIVDYIKRIPYTLQNYRLKIPEDIQTKFVINPKNLWDRILGKPKDELFDGVLEVAAFSRQLMIQAYQLQDKIPPQAFRAFLHQAEAEYYLEQLEFYNFNVFEKPINQNSYIKLPIRIYGNARKQKFLKNTY